MGRRGTAASSTFDYAEANQKGPALQRAFGGTNTSTQCPPPPFVRQASVLSVAGHAIQRSGNATEAKAVIP